VTARHLDTAKKAKSRSQSANVSHGQHILVVEDESDLQQLLRYNLEREGYQVSVCASGEQALELVLENAPDLIVLDLMLPGLDGLSVCTKIRHDSATKSVPIVMLTAKGEEADIVVGLKLGADDYVTKPFSPRVLLARVSAVLRRHEVQPESDRILVADGKISIDPGRHVVKVNGEEASLTLTEYRLLHYLAMRPGFVRTREQIISAVRGEGTVLSSRAVDVHIAGLRNKLGDFANVIETVRGIGYRMSEATAVTTG